MLKCNVESAIDVKKLNPCTQEDSIDFNANWTTMENGLVHILEVPISSRGN